jgi:hypothetical protein
VLALVIIAATRIATADVVTETGTIEGVTVDGVFQPIARTTVRIVGEAVVMTTHSDASGAVHVTHLPPGRYRIEVDGGTFSVRKPPRPMRLTLHDADRPFTYDRKFVHCCICAMERMQRSFTGEAAPVEPPLIDTHSTTLGIRLDRRDF